MSSSGISRLDIPGLRKATQCIPLKCRNTSTEQKNKNRCGAGESIRVETRLIIILIINDNHRSKRQAIIRLVLTETPLQLSRDTAI